MRYPPFNTNFLCQSNDEILSIKRLKWFIYGTLILGRVLVLLLDCLGAYLLVCKKVPKTVGFDKLSVDTNRSHLMLLSYQLQKQFYILIKQERLNFNSGPNIGAGQILVIMLFKIWKI